MPLLGRLLSIETLNSNYHGEGLPVQYKLLIFNEIPTITIKQLYIGVSKKIERFD